MWRRRAGPSLPDDDRYRWPQLRELLGQARTFVGSAGRFPTVCQWFCRDKYQDYFDYIGRRCNGVMKTNRKDNHGDPKNPINERLDGLFFTPTASSSEHSDSPFGDRRLKILASKMVERVPNLYFSDFYCVSKRRRPHYVQIVMTRPGSPADMFCYSNLTRLNSSDNPFFYWKTRNVIKLVAEPSNDSELESEVPTEGGEEVSKDDCTMVSDGEAVEEMKAKKRIAAVLETTEDKRQGEQSTEAENGATSKGDLADEIGIAERSVLPRRSARLEAKEKQATAVLEKAEAENGSATSKRDLEDEIEDGGEKPAAKKPRLDQCQNHDESISQDTNGNSEENPSPLVADPAPSTSGAKPQSRAQRKARVVKETTCYINPQHGSSFWVELFFTEDVDMKLGEPLTSVTSFGRRSGGYEGLPKNSDCPICCLPKNSDCPICPENNIPRARLRQEQGFGGHRGSGSSAKPFRGGPPFQRV